MTDIKLPGVTINVDAGALLAAESKPDGTMTLKCRALSVVGPMQIKGSTASAGPAGPTKVERAEIKQALLESVRSGAHGHMDPHSLAESMLSAFTLLDRLGSPAEDGCKA